MLYKNILDTIGNTPSIKLNNISINDVDLYVKAEYFNPASSVKDRLAVSIIENAESRSPRRRYGARWEGRRWNWSIQQSQKTSDKK